MKEYPFKNLPGLNNIEIERDETLFFENGNLYKIKKGKKHKQGGEDIFVPNNTKILSEHLKLPSDISTALNSLERKLKSSSPAKISEKFNTLRWKEILEDNTSRYDSLSKNTAKIMLAKNISHLDNIFAAQEEFKKSKGLKNDVDKLQSFKNGGLSKAQNGKLFGTIDVNEGSGLPEWMQNATGDLRLQIEQILGSHQSTPINPTIPQNNPIINKTKETIDNSIYDKLPDYSTISPDLNFYKTESDRLLISNNANSTSINKILQYNPGDIIEREGLKYKVTYTDKNTNDNPNYISNLLNKSAIFTGKTNILPNNKTLQNRQEYLENERESLAIFKENPDLLESLTQAEKDYINRLSIDRNPDISGKDPITYKDPIGNERDEDNQGQFIALARREHELTQLPLKDSPLEFENKFPELKVDEPVNVDVKRVRTEEKGIDKGKFIDGIQTGLLLTQLATAEKQNPYYSYSPLKVAYSRFDPINTLSQERAFNLSKESIMNSNIPEQVKLARLNDLYSSMVDNVGKVDTQNYQGNLQNNNLNTQILNTTRNANIQSREAANKQYIVEEAESQARLQMFKNKAVEQMMDIWRNREQTQYQRKLFSQLSKNYNIDNQGNTRFQSGQGTPYDENLLSAFTYKSSEEQK